MKDDMVDNIGGNEVKNDPMGDFNKIDKGDDNDIQDPMTSREAFYWVLIAVFIWAFIYQLPT